MPGTVPALQLQHADLELFFDSMVTCMLVMVAVQVAVHGDQAPTVTGAAAPGKLKDRPPKHPNPGPCVFCKH